MQRISLVLVFCLPALPVIAADVAVRVQPDFPIANESFRIIFQADGPVDAEPDFDELESRVEILGRNRQTSIQWINGRNSRTTTWVLDVLARTAGTLEIPAVAFGADRSDARVIEVKAAQSGAGAAADAGLLLEIEVDNDNPYVQEEVILTARLLRRVELSDANMTDPETNADAIIKRLGNDSTYQIMRNEKRYEVFERRYSIFPQTSGTVTIAPMVLTTQLVPATRSLFDPFRQSVQTRRIESNGITLNVKPIPPGYTGATWLPARRLRLRDDWEPPGDALASGEPLTRTVFMWADGLNAGQLPEVPVSLPPGLKSYPDQPQSSEQQTDDGFTAIRQQKFAIIPNAAGEIVFPEIAVTWWNTDADRMEVARLGERHFTITGAEPSAAEPQPGPTDIIPDAATPSTAAAAPSVVAAGGEQSDSIRLVAIICLVGWVATALAWWWRARRGIPPAVPAPPALPESLAKARRDVIGACKANDARASKRALLAWSRLAFAAPAPGTLGALAAAVPAPLDAEIRALDATLYGPGAGTWDAFALKEAFEHSEIPVPGSETGASRPAPLPPLYRLSGG